MHMPRKYFNKKEYPRREVQRRLQATSPVLRWYRSVTLNDPPMPAAACRCWPSSAVTWLLLQPQLPRSSLDAVLWSD